MIKRITSLLLALALGVAALSPAFAQCPAPVPAQGAALPGGLPLLPSSNWWNLDISDAPVAVNSASHIAFINNGGTRRLHPDFGGEAEPGSVDVYGMPYAIVNGAQPKQAVTFDYADESDGVDRTTGQGVPFYPIPAQAITQPHWIEGGAPGSVDQRDDSDRHLLLIDCTNRFLYELYNVWYDATRAKWHAGSGAFFDLDADGRRPDTWTSADAAGLAIFPGLVRYDEAWNPAVSAIGHAFRVTVRATNGYVYPASPPGRIDDGRIADGSAAAAQGQRERPGSGAAHHGSERPQDLPRDAEVRAHRRRQRLRHVCERTFDTRWNNDILNPAFALLSAGDFDVVQLGWNPPVPVPSLASFTLDHATTVGGIAFFATVTLSAPAPAGGATVALSTSNALLARPPASIVVAAGATTRTFLIPTLPTRKDSAAAVTATYAGAAKTAPITVTLR